MNQDKYNISMSGGAIESSIHDFNVSASGMEYDETELLSKMFSKDQNRSGFL